MLKQIIGAILTIVGVAVAIHTIAEPLYHASSDGQPYSPFWENILNPLMVLAIILGLIFGYIRKKSVDGSDAITREYLAANTQFYGLLFVGILFFWNYFNLHSDAFTAIGEETVSLVWILIDASLPLLLGAMGISLLRANDE
jgi:p-aminobenzoyl-glutamate transporter AbgT